MDQVVDNHAQYCSIVRTGFGKIKMIIGGEVDAGMLTIHSLFSTSRHTDHPTSLGSQTLRPVHPYQLGRAQNRRPNRIRPRSYQIRTQTPQILGAVFPTWCPQNRRRVPLQGRDLTESRGDRNAGNSRNDQTRQTALGWECLHQFRSCIS